MRIIICGGGTAGHVFPVILVGKELMKNHQVLYVGSRQGIEKTILSKFKIPYRLIFAGKKRSYFSFSNYWDSLKVLFGIIQSYFIISRFRPDVIFAKGGFVTFPVLFWAKRKKIPLVIHESDSIMGKANLWASSFAKKICLGFPVDLYSQNLPTDKLIYTGIPIDEAFFQKNLENEESKNILITGGSQGSRAVNDLVLENLPEILSKYEVYHLVGKNDIGKFIEFENNPNYHSEEFSEEMPRLLKKADLVVCRAGASTLTEISAAKKASIIIPLKTSANNHQEANARIYQRNNAAFVFDQDSSAKELFDKISEIMENKETRHMLEENSGKFYKSNAAEKIKNAIESLRT